MYKQSKTKIEKKKNFEQVVIMYQFFNAKGRKSTESIIYVFRVSYFPVVFGAFWVIILNKTKTELPGETVNCT